MRRRSVLLAAAAAAGSSLAGTRLAAANPPRVGILDPGLPQHFAAFLTGMAKLGYVEGQNVTYIRSSSAGQTERLPQLAAELAEAKVDVIVTAGPAPVRAAMKATAAIPIIFTTLGDPIAAGAVSNLARPDRNATGLSFANTEVAAKRVQLLHEILPAARRIAILCDPNSPRASLDATLAAARTLGLEAKVSEVGVAVDFGPAFEAMRASEAEAIDILASPFFNSNRAQLVDLAARHRLPAMWESDEFARSGGLISYGASLVELFRRAAGYVDRILKGARPSDLPVEQPTKFELVINMKTAKALGLTIPPSILARADEVIE